MKTTELTHQSFYNRTAYLCMRVAAGISGMSLDAKQTWTQSHTMSDTSHLCGLEVLQTTLRLTCLISKMGITVATLAALLYD